MLSTNNAVYRFDGIKDLTVFQQFSIITAPIAIVQVTLESDALNGDPARSCPDTELYVVTT